MNFALFLEIKARTAPDELALVDQRLRLTWSELDSWSNRLAAMLSQRGMGRSDRMAVLLPNRAEAVITLLGCMKAGVVAVPLNWRLAGQELYRVVAHCKPGCLLTTQERAQDLSGHLKGSALLMSLGDEPKEGSFWSAIQDVQPRYRAAACQSADVANLLYTSGTTSAPKAA
ncbi:MAG: long-chain fatty acid--CoA ligase, partial [Alphaproteobacteria bacterium]|nr:long-chain fatty acid--CoA ligase [Alphaproteobacteria bacterium]